MVSSRAGRTDLALPDLDSRDVHSLFLGLSIPSWEATASLENIVTEKQFSQASMRSRAMPSAEPSKSQSAKSSLIIISQNGHAKPTCAKIVELVRSSHTTGSGRTR